MAWFYLYLDLSEEIVPKGIVNTVLTMRVNHTIKIGEALTNKVKTKAISEKVAYTLPEENIKINSEVTAETVVNTKIEENKGILTKINVT